MAYLGNRPQAAGTSQTDAEIKTAYEANADTNEFSDTEQTKLSGIEASATADQTKAEIEALNIDADTLDGIDSTSLLRSDTADTKTAGDLGFSDNVKATFGDGNDLQIYHLESNNNSYITESGSGNLYINGTDIRLRDGSSVNYFKGVSGGEVALYYGTGLKKLATTSSGIDVTGSVTSSSTFKLTQGSGNILEVGSGADKTVISNGWTSGVGDWLKLEVPSADDEGGMLQINSNGQVGIGTSDPKRKVHIHSSGNSDLHLTNTATGFSATDGATITMASNGTDMYINNRESNGTQLFYIGGTERLRIDSTGSVGIGVSSPSAKLDVAGDIKADAVTLDAISASITGNAVDIFIYDTSKDSDGGAWRKRTQHTSWYNEPDLPTGTGAGQFNSLTRSTRKDFPAVAVIVAEASKVIIYDGDDPDMPMWMVFTSGGGSFSNHTMLGQNSTNTAVAIRNGVMGVTKVGGQSLVLIDFLKETSEILRQSNDDGLRGFHTSRELANRNVQTGEHHGTLRALASNNSNDVAMTVLPNAPIDSATGLPTPTIAVATDGGVSVIKDDGTVVDITANAGSSYSGASFIDIDDNYNLVFEQDGSGRGVFYIPIPRADRTTTTNDGDRTDKRMLPTSSTGTGLNAIPRTNGSNTTIATAGKDNDLYVYAGTGVTSYRYGTTKQNSSVAYITSKYNTGYMTGDIRGAWNVDTDVTTFGNELVPSADFSDFTPQSGQSVITKSGGTLSIVNGDGTNRWAYASNINIVAGKQYIVTLTGSGSGTGVGIYINSSQFSLGYTWNKTITYHATTTGSVGLSVFRFGGHNGTGTITGLSVKEAIPDRSVKGNGLAVHGSPTVSAVATGAELKCISGFSSSNYLEQPYNSDLDFGTGDFSMMGWFQEVSTIANDALIDRADVGGDKRFQIGFSGTGGFGLYTQDGSASSAYTSQTFLGSATWHFGVCVRNSSGLIEIYVDGLLSKSVNTTSRNITSATGAGVTSIGVNYAHTNSFGGGIALPRISATAPSAEQIKEIYEAEKPMFQANAKCTLNGSSDAVTALAYDDSTELLHVGTSGGRSVFQGLRRVDETSTSTTEIAAQGGLIIEET